MFIVNIQSRSALHQEHSILPLRLFCKEPIHNFLIVIHLPGFMNLFSDLAAVLKRLRKIGPKTFHSVQQMAGTGETLPVSFEELFVKLPEFINFVGDVILAGFDNGR